MDQGSVFTRKQVVEYVNSRHIRMLTSTPYYVRVNSQVEAINEIIIGLMKNHVDRQPKNWHNTLDQLLWAYINSAKESKGTSPYMLVYGHDPILAVEINLQSTCIKRQDDLFVDEYWNVMFDELNALSDERLIAIEVGRTIQNHPSFFWECLCTHQY